MRACARDVRYRPVPPRFSCLTHVGARHRILFSACPIRLSLEVAVMFLRGAIIQPDGHGRCGLFSSPSLSNYRAELSLSEGDIPFDCPILIPSDHPPPVGALVSDTTTTGAGPTPVMRATPPTSLPRRLVEHFLPPSLPVTWSIVEFKLRAEFSSTTVRTPRLLPKVGSVRIGRSGRAQKDSRGEAARE